ncbi:amidohydrolase family protein [Streptomyces sp. SID3343]|nr:amidohydrolase family protein [Streptomyces sp. SID3343]MYV99959.1 amidohydrolase family protein [Streptomyces sp. SID3343]
MQGAGVVALVGVSAGHAVVLADAAEGGSLSFTAATNGAATVHPAGGELVAEVQNVLWSVPLSGGPARALTTPDLEPTRPTFSPDGRLLAFAAYRGGGFHLWTMGPDGSGLRQLTDGPWDDRSPAWSPDGTQLAFASERGGDPVTGSPYRVWTVDPRSGALTRVSGLPHQEGPPENGAWEDFDPTWSPRGDRILFVRADAGGSAPAARSIVSVRADGVGPVTVEHTDPVANAQIVAPAISPLGRLAYVRTTGTAAHEAGSASCTLVVDGKSVPIEGDLLPVPPRWTPDEELLLNVDGQFRIVSPDAPTTGRRIPFLATLPLDRPRYRAKRHEFDAPRARPVRGIHLPALSPDGDRVVFAALNALWIASTSGGAAPRRIVSAQPTRYVMAPTWTSDGRGVVFADDRDGLFAIRRLDPESGRETVLASGGRVHPALSPDGTRLASQDMAGNLVLTDLANGTERILAAPLAGGGLPGRPSWSPDGRRIALCERNRLNRRFREGYNLVRVLDTGPARDGVGTDSAGPEQPSADRLYAVAPHTSISDRYDSGPVWSPDGRSMAVIVESALCLLPVRPDGSPDGELRHLTTESADHPSWARDTGQLLYLSAGRLRLLDAPAATGRARTVRVPLDHRPPTPADLVVHAGRLWDGTGEAVRDDVDVVVRGGRVAAIEPHRARRPAVRSLDASQRTVLPGLWDSHTHPWQSTYGGRQTTTQLAYGITTAVSLGGFAYEQARLKEAVAAGELAGPRLLSTGELLDGARVAYSMGRAHRTRAGLARSLSRAAALDWDVVKTYVRAPGWLMAEAARYAHEELGVRVGSHLCSPGVNLGHDLTTHLQATQRVEFGRAVSATGHAYQDVEEIYTATNFSLIATPFTALALLGADPALAEDERVTVLMPPWDRDTVRTLAAQPPTDARLAALDTEIAIYRRVLHGGGLVALGTDAPLVPVGLQLHLGLRALHDGGLSAAQTLRTATVLPARLFGVERDLGTLEPGKLADVTIVDGDPFTDFDTTARTVAVLCGGTLHEQPDLIRAFAPGTPKASADAPLARPST